MTQYHRLAEEIARSISNADGVLAVIEENLDGEGRAVMEAIDSVRGSLASALAKADYIVEMEEDDDSITTMTGHGDQIKITTLKLEKPRRSRKKAVRS